MTFRGDLFYEGRLFLFNISGSVQEDRGQLDIVLNEAIELPCVREVYEIRTEDASAFTIFVNTVLMSETGAVVMFKVTERSTYGD